MLTNEPYCKVLPQLLKPKHPNGIKSTTNKSNKVSSALSAH